MISMISTRFFIIAFIAVISTFVNIPSAFSGDYHSITRLEKELSCETLEVLSLPDSVTVEFCDKHLTFLGAQQIRDIQDILLTDKSYDFEFTKESIFIPSSTLTFTKDCKSVQITISRHAQQILFVFGNERVILDCDPGFSKLDALLSAFEESRRRIK